jgi:hypothetical protein
MNCAPLMAPGGMIRVCKDCEEWQEGENEAYAMTRLGAPGYARRLGVTNGRVGFRQTPKAELSAS